MCNTVQGAGLDVLHMEPDEIRLPFAAVSARLGHSSIWATQAIYAHMIAGQDEEAARQWEAYHKRNLPVAGDGPQIEQEQLPLTRVPQADFWPA